MSKTIYHSELVRLCDGRPITVKIKSDVLKSKYKREGHDSFYVEMVVEGQSRTYTCENRACEDALDRLQGKTVELTANGREEDATIEVEVIPDADEGRDRDRGGSTDRNRGDSRREEQPRREERREERRREPEPREREREPDRPREDPKMREAAQPRKAPSDTRPAAHSPEEAVIKFKSKLARGAIAYRLCLDAVSAMIAQDEEDNEYRAMDIEDVRCIASNLFIFMDRSGMIDDLPRKLPESEAPKDGDRDETGTGTGIPASKF